MTVVSDEGFPSQKTVALGDWSRRRRRRLALSSEDRKERVFAKTKIQCAQQTKATKDPQIINCDRVCYDLSQTIDFKGTNISAEKQRKHRL